MPYDNDPKKRNDYMREYRRRKTREVWEPRRRGRKPVDMRLLNMWEFEWYKALHLLRDGVQLPPDPTSVIVNQREARALLQWWKKVSIKEIVGEMRPGTPPPFDDLPENERAKAKIRWEMREWTWLKKFAEAERKSEITSLERGLKPRQIPAITERRKIWDALIHAHTVSAIEDACDKWSHLTDVRSLGFACFTDHILANATKFFQIKQDPRFPLSAYADETRLEHLARGMAGVMVGVSPVTANERLRNMKHEKGGPFWNKAEEYCGCWRCRLRRSHAYYENLKGLQI